MVQALASIFCSIYINILKPNIRRGQGIWVHFLCIMTFLLMAKHHQFRKTVAAFRDIFNFLLLSKLMAGSWEILFRLSLNMLSNIPVVGCFSPSTLLFAHSFFILSKLEMKLEYHVTENLSMSWLLWKSLFHLFCKPIWNLKMENFGAWPPPDKIFCATILDKNK